MDNNKFGESFQGIPTVYIDQSPSPPSPPPPPPITQYKVLIFLTFYLWHYTTTSFILFNILYLNWFEANHGGNASHRPNNIVFDDDVQTNKTLFWKVIHRRRNSFFSFSYGLWQTSQQLGPGFGRGQCNEIGEQGAHDHSNDGDITDILDINMASYNVLNINPIQHGSLFFLFSSVPFLL